MGINLKYLFGRIVDGFKRGLAEAIEDKDTVDVDAESEVAEPVTHRIGEYGHWRANIPNRGRNFPRKDLIISLQTGERVYINDEPVVPVSNVKISEPRVARLEKKPYPKAAVLSFPYGDIVFYEESTDDITPTQPQYKRSCEMPRPTKRAMRMEEFAEFCAAMPPGIGEEEYCARVIEHLEGGGDAA